MTALFFIWVLFNGRIAWDVAAVGIAVCILVGYMLKKAMNYSFIREMKFILKLPHLMRFVLVIIKEVIVSNIMMIKVILNPWSRLNAQLYFFTPELETDIARVVLANTITLTPGTNTVQLKNGRLCVHAIGDEFIEGVGDSTITKEAKKLEAKFKNV